MTEQDYIDATNLRTVRILRRVAADDLLFMGEENKRLKQEICIRLDLLEDTLQQRVEAACEGEAVTATRRYRL